MVAAVRLTPKMRTNNSMVLNLKILSLLSSYLISVAIIIYSNPIFSWSDTSPGNYSFVPSSGHFSVSYLEAPS